jgi:hypothetical protein
MNLVLALWTSKTVVKPLGSPALFTLTSLLTLVLAPLTAAPVVDFAPFVPAVVLFLVYMLSVPAALPEGPMPVPGPTLRGNAGPARPRRPKQGHLISSCESVSDPSAANAGPQ